VKGAALKGEFTPMLLLYYVMKMAYEVTPTNHPSGVNGEDSQRSEAHEQPPAE